MASPYYVLIKWITEMRIKRWKFPYFLALCFAFLVIALKKSSVDEYINLFSDLAKVTSLLSQLLKKKIEEKILN